MTSSRKPRRFGHGEAAVAVTRAMPALEANQHGKGEVRSSKKFQAYCACGTRLMATTPEAVKAGIQPRCSKCPPAGPHGGELT